MKRALPLCTLLILIVGCRKASTPAAAAPATPAAPPQSAQAQTAAPVVKPMPAKLPNVVAKVNGEPIERWELENGLKRAEARAGSVVPPEKRDEVLRGVLDQLVAYHLVAQAARDQKVDVTDADVEGQMQTIRQSFPTEQAFQQGIAAQALTMDELKRQTRMSLQIQKVIESQINSKVSIADSEVDAFYKQNLDRFKEGESVHASHILIGVQPGSSAADKQAAKAKAQQILKQVRGGGDFGALARETSQDPGSAPNGGDLGFFQKGQMTPAFEKAAFELKPGAISNVIESPFGFHIIKVIERRPARTVPFAEVSPQIKDFLTQNQRQTKLQQFIDEKKAKTKIEILV
jgi:peptidyl-prolyl cis-trans isomerase C